MRLTPAGNRQSRMAALTAKPDCRDRFDLDGGGFLSPKPVRGWKTCSLPIRDLFPVLFALLLWVGLRRLAETRSRPLPSPSPERRGERDGTTGSPPLQGGGSETVLLASYGKMVLRAVRQLPIIDSASAARKLEGGRRADAGRSPQSRSEVAAEAQKGQGKRHEMDPRGVYSLVGFRSTPRAAPEWWDRKESLSRMVQPGLDDHHAH